MGASAVVALGALLLAYFATRPREQHESVQVDGARDDSLGSELEPDLVAAEKADATVRINSVRASRGKELAALGSVCGSVSLYDETPVAFVQLELLSLNKEKSQRLNLPATATTDQDGVFAFSGLSLGSYMLRIVPDSLPSGVLAPRRQGMCAPGGIGLTEFSHCFEIEQHHIDIERNIVLASCVSVSGRVMDSAGQPFAGVHVRFSGAESQNSASSFDCLTDVDGAYEIDCVGSGLGDLWVRVYLPPGHSAEGLNAPETARINLDPTQAYRRIHDLIFTHGDASLFGRLVDQYGEGVPFAGMLVYRTIPDSIRLWRIRSFLTDKDGTFRVDTLPDGPCFLQVGVEWAKARPYVWHGKPPTLGVALDSGSALSLGEIVVSRELDFWVNGRVEIGSGWSEEPGVENFAMHVEGEHPEQGSFRSEIPIHSDWTFQLRIRTPCQRASIVLAYDEPWDGPYLPAHIADKHIAVQLHPTPNGVEEFVIVFTDTEPKQPYKEK